MTSTITNFSNNIDVNYPSGGKDNDISGFRANFTNIKNSLDTAASEITSIEIEQKRLSAQLLSATAIGNEYAATIASTVTTLVVNSLTNTVPAICTTITQAWYNNTITNALNNLQTQITTNTNKITVLESNYGLISSATIYVSSAPPTSKGILGDKIGMIHANSTTLYVCYANYVNGVPDIWAKITTDGGTW